MKRCFFRIAFSMLCLFYLQLSWSDDFDLGMGLTEAEKQAIRTAINSSKRISKIATNINGLPHRRDAHAKTTGCVRATFSVNSDIPERFHHSIFSLPGREYRSWIRFSNGDMLIQPDSKGDARGFAIKVMNVEGKNIAPELGEPGSQDFVMSNNPAFFNRNIFDYAESIQYLAKFQRVEWFVSVFPPRLHPKRLYRAIQTVSSKIDTPLAPQYFSILPYQLGNTILKFSVKPCEGMSFAKVEDKDNPDYLTIELERHLSKQGACFDFMVQPQVPGVYMPIDDATVIWPEDESPFIPIATINIPPQENITTEVQQQFCENLSMNPWHGVGQWQPLGSLNKARRVVYNAVSKYRHRENKVTRFEPKSWCIEESSEPCTKHQGLLISKSNWPLPRCFDNLFYPIGRTERDIRSQCGTKPY